MINFKLKPGIKFTPQEQKFIVEDTATQSTYRIGENEYQILSQMGEPTNVEEVGYRLRTELGLDIPYDKLNAFIQKAIKLDLIEAVDDSAWSRIVSSGLFASRMSFFNPDPFLESVIRLWRRTKLLWVASGGVLLLGAMVISVVYFRQLWALKSFSIPAYAPFVILFLYASSFGHELLHGLAAKYYGCRVPEVGFHMQYYIPSFYCKILKARDAEKKNVGIILLAGSLFDLAIASLLVLVWFFGSTNDSLRAVISFTISLIWVKILLVNLNPFLPLSDGYRILGLFFSGRRGQ